MINYTTEIDTIAIQLDYDTGELQRYNFELLKQLIISRKLGKLKLDIDMTNLRIHNLYYKKKLLCRIHLGLTRTKTRDTDGLIDKYYIRIKFCGLKSYHWKYDVVASNTWFTICAYLNDLEDGGNYRIVELDVAIDIYASFNRILVTCLKKASHTQYNPLGHIMIINGASTSYLETFKNWRKRNNATLRSYVYDKSKKEGLIDSKITRYEVKFQSRFFIDNNEWDVDSIQKVFKKYQIMYFYNSRKKQQVVRQLQEANKLIIKDFYPYRYDYMQLHLDSTYLKRFFLQTKRAYISFGNVRVPSISDDELQ